jgi:hypothetical protein
MDGRRIHYGDRMKIPVDLIVWFSSPGPPAPPHAEVEVNPAHLTVRAGGSICGSDSSIAVS